VTILDLQSVQFLPLTSDPKWSNQSFKGKELKAMTATTFDVRKYLRKAMGIDVLGSSLTADAFIGESTATHPSHRPP